MKRLVYSPSVKVWVKSDSGVIDLSPYVTNCRINRKINEQSTAEITFRNPKISSPDGTNRFMWTQHEYTSPQGDTSVRPVFHPMDPITITFERIAGRPIQVFTGYCDTTPYVQLFPGLARIKASCTLKRLNYTYWDPALQFTMDFMKNYGWSVSKTGQAINEKQSAEAEKAAGRDIRSVNLNDSSIANLVYATLNEVGGWNPSNIFIQSLPSNISTKVANLFDEITKDNKTVNTEITQLLKDTLGSGSFGLSAASGGNNGNAGGSGSGAGSSPVLAANAPTIMAKWKTEADRIFSIKTKYSTGGSAGLNERGPGAIVNPPKFRSGPYAGCLAFDCSSFVTYMLNFIGLYNSDMNHAQVSGWYASNWGEAGVGKYLTVWANDHHVFFELMNGGPSRFIGTSNSSDDLGIGKAVIWEPYNTAGYVARQYPGL